MQNWIISLAAAAFIAGIAGTLAPEGKMRGAVSLVCGFMTIAVMLSPISSLNFDGLADSIQRYALQIDEYEAAFAADNEKSLNSVIAEQTSAYIFDKTGYSAVVTVHNDLPYSVTVNAPFDPYASDVIADDLGIPRERQEWTIDN